MLHVFCFIISGVNIFFVKKMDNVYFGKKKKIMD